MMSLPEAFVKRMAAQLGDELPAFLRTYEQDYTRGIRFNPFKAVDSSLLPEGMGDPVPWEPTGYYLSLDSTAGAQVLHEAGAYYLQEPSAMIPAAVLNPQPGERVLDLCAAPGGKSTQLGLRMAGQGTLVCNEPVFDRAKILSRNIERMGIPNALVISAYPDRLSAYWPEAFDAIQCDAPCSGEGMFRRHPETRAEWLPESPAGCAKRQAEILDYAAIMLRPGGRLVYSTCTLNPIENEDTVNAFLQRHPEFRMEDFALPGLVAAKGMLTIYPHRVRGEGHFVALLRKGGDGQASWKAASPALDAAAKNAVRVFGDFAPSQVVTAVRLLGVDQRRTPEYELNVMEDMPDMSGKRAPAVLRAGLTLGTVKGKVFVPDHAWAMSICPPDIPRVELTLEQAKLYQSGQTVEAEGKGWALACYGGLALGWGKISDGVMKNHYPKGLRR